MKIAIFVTEAYYKKEDLYGVSGHVQIPLKAAGLLAETIQNVDIITTKPHDAEFLITDFPSNVIIRTVIHATKKWPETGIFKKKAILQFFQLLRIVKAEQYDIVHFFGGPKTGLLGSCIKIFNSKIRVFFSPIAEPSFLRFFLIDCLLMWLYRKLDSIIPTSEYVSQKWGELVGVEKIHVIKPGILKVMSHNAYSSKHDIVLYWRNADYDNGADIMISVVKIIASEYKTIRFVFAVRPGSAFQEAMLQLERDYSNVFVYVYPYKNGVTLESLLRETLLVIAPYRRLSINPQISILETLLAGVPVIASNVESNNEIIQNGITGLITENNSVEDFATAARLLLDNRNLLRTLTDNTISETASRYNWNTFKEQLLNIYYFKNT